MTISLTDVGSGYKRSAINSNFTTIENEINNNLLNKNGGVGLEADLDANSQKVINLADGVNNKDAVNLQQLNGAIAAAGSGLIAMQKETQKGSQAVSRVFTASGVSWDSSGSNLIVTQNGTMLYQGRDYTIPAANQIEVVAGHPLNANDDWDFRTNVATTNSTTNTSAITHTQSGTNYNLATYLQNRYVVHIADYSPAGNGVTDDTTEFNSAISDTPEGGTLVLETGKTYLISSIFIGKVINIDLNGATVKGVALGSVGITFTENAHIYNGTSDNVFFAWSGTNVTQGSCKKVKFINPTYTATTAVHGARGVVIERNYFTGRASGPTGIPGATTFPTFQVTTGATNCKYINNIAIDVEAGVTSDGINSNSDAVEVRGNFFQKLRFYALKTDVGNLFTFKDNYVGDARYGIFYANADASGVEINRTSGNQLVVENNSFVSVTDNPTNSVAGDSGVSGCLYVAGANNPYTRVVFRDNYMTGCDVGCARSAGHTIIQGNHFYNGYSLYDYVNTAVKSGDLKILNNVIDVTKEIVGRGNDLEGEAIKAAILLGSTTQDAGSNWVPHIQIVGNTFRDCHTNCIQLARVAAAFPQIKIKDNVFDAGANTVNNINISTAIGLTIKDNEIESAVSGDNIKYPNTARIGGNIVVEGNEWQIVSTAPTTGTHLRGTVFRNSAPAASGNYGWICTTTGDLAASGVVKSFGTIAS